MKIAAVTGKFSSNQSTFPLIFAETKNTYVRVCTRVRMCMCAHVCVHVCACLCVCVCVLGYSYLDFYCRSH